MVFSPPPHTFLCGLGMFPSGPDSGSMWPAPGLLEQSFCMLEASEGARGRGEEDSELHVLISLPHPELNRDLETSQAMQLAGHMFLWALGTSLLPYKLGRREM
ncbi:transcription factor 19 [Platysternon megacephalum]|uniref:Transcription factor 19 n=1 Tax=Platysternon megacephalum TaxID=55544 RepID=A0A4D9DLE9_9SAUR|nr:transcription factor 19 [Platysternon megacephalum]